MNLYLAKSTPRETIQEHTDKLLDNYELLKQIYPEINVDWFLLKLACLIHDLGKMNYKFQARITNGKRYQDEIPHGYLSIAFIPHEKLTAKGYTVGEIRALFHSIAKHHARKVNFNSRQLNPELALLATEWKDFEYDKLGEYRAYYPSIRQCFSPFQPLSARSSEEIYKKYVMLKGLLNRIDYAASAGIEVEKKNDFLEAGMDQKLVSLKKQDPEADWRPLQKYMRSHQAENLVVTAETGMGKTEAGLLWLGNHKGFFTLPLRTAINAIYERVVSEIVQTDQQKRVGLLHSETYGQYLQAEDNLGTDDIDDYYEQTRQLSLPLTICTVDQLFDFIFRYPGFEYKLATLAYSKVIIDEIQMYAADVLAYLICGLDYIHRFDGKFCIMTATLPPIITDLLTEKGISFVKPNAPFVSTRIRHRLKVIEAPITSSYIQEAYHNNRILVICNTINQAKKIFETLKELYPGEVHLIHSQFIKKDRETKASAVLSDGKIENQKSCIWVATQVVEASLDIDFDLLFTELSDLNGLFQRMGRCYRNREVDEHTNVFVFDGGKRKCSGVGKFIDKMIFNASKTILRRSQGIISEMDKVKMIEATYTTEALANSEFYTVLKNNITYVGKLYEEEIDKKEAIQRFRNIHSATIIPEPIWLQNETEINQYIDILRAKGISNKEKNLAQSKLSEFMVAIPYYLFEKGKSYHIRLSKKTKITIFECNYSSVYGISLKEVSEENPFF